jgi:hypothetical protein
MNRPQPRPRTGAAFIVPRTRLASPYYIRAWYGNSAFESIQWPCDYVNSYGVPFYVIQLIVDVRRFVENTAQVARILRGILLMSLHRERGWVGIGGGVSAVQADRRW